MRIWALVLLTCGVAATSAAQLHGPKWLPFGPDGGDARRIRVDPQDHAHLYLGTANGWIYESHNRGVNWVRLARVGKRDDLVLDSIVIDPANPKHLVVGGWVIDHPDGGMFLSNDGGATWMSQAEMRGQSVRSLAISPSDPKILVAGTLQGVFRSTDGGMRWTRISPADSTEIHEVQSVAIDPKDPNVVYAGTWHLPWHTTDAGEHWDNMKEGIIDDSDVFSIIVDPDSPKVVYASACSGIYKSENGGGLFHKVQGIPSTARRTHVLLQDPHHLETVFAGTTEGLYRSDDAGKKWSLTTGPEIIVNDVSVDLDDPKHVLIATDRGGVLSSEDGGDTFHSSNGGFSARQIVALKRDINHPATVYVGVVNDKDWGGVFQSDNGAINWTQRSEGLQGRDVFALGQSPDGTMIAGTSHGIFRLDQEAKVWNRVENIPLPAEPAGLTHAAPALTRPPVPGGRNLYAPGKSAKANGARKNAVAAKSRSSASSHRGKTLTASKRTASKTGGVVAKAVPARAPATVAAAAPAAAPKVFDGSVYGIATAGHMLLATTSSGLLTSGDEGVTWAPAGPRSSVDWRILAAAKENVVAAGLHSVEFSADAGKTWAPVKVPAELTQVSGVAVEPSGAIWVGGREGVYVSSDAGNNWTTPKNLYVNSVNNIFYDEGSQRIVVTTGGTNSIVFLVSLPKHEINYADAGWNLRFARPIGDHLIAATLFDGIVVQPRMMASPVAPASKAAIVAPAVAPVAAGTPQE